jgi:hypothetical protein
MIRTTNAAAGWRWADAAAGLLALAAAIWHNDRARQAVRRSLIAYGD